MRSRNTVLSFRLLAGTIALLFCVSLAAQWTPQASGSRQTLRDVTFLDADTGLAAGDTSTVLRTTDGGRSWLPLASDFKENFRSAVPLSADSLLIAGGNFFEGSVYRSTNGGFDWDYTGQGIDLAVTPDWVFALDNETIYKSPNRGGNWKESVIIIGSTTVLERLYFPSSSTGYAIGNVGGFATYSAMAFRSSDEGDSWNLLFDADYPNSYAYTAAAAPHPDTLYLFSNQYVSFQPGPRNQLWRLTGFYFSNENFFRGWRFTSEVVNDDMPAFITDATFLTTQLGYATGADGRIYRTTNGGRDWQVDYDGATPLTAIFMLDANTGYAVGEQGAILRRDGATATQRPAPLAARLYPNPACDHLIIQLPAGRPAAARLFNATGQLVRQGALDGRGELPLHGLPAGAYALELRTRDGVFREKVVLRGGCE